MTPCFPLLLVVVLFMAPFAAWGASPLIDPPPALDQAAPLSPSSPAARTSGGEVPVKPGPLVGPGARGYWFYYGHKHPPRVPYKAQTQPKKKKPETCQKAETWTPKCGFVTPKSFSMQAMERDALLRQMVMNPGDPKNVEAVQAYSMWVVNQSIYAADVARYNSLQYPKQFDPASQSPISTAGLRLAAGIKDTDRTEVWKTIRDMGGFLVIFTKADCDYCHGQVQPMWWLARDTKLPVWDASLGGPCLKTWEKRCLDTAKSTLPGRILHVSTVPTVFLYLPANTWIRVAAGLTDTQTMEDRLYNLFISFKVAAVNAKKETGHTGLALNTQDHPKTSQALRKLLAAPIPASTDKTP